MSKQKSPDPEAPLIDGADAPIRSLSEDRLGRRSFGQALAAEVMAAPAARGFVMGLTGPWGSGKTSVLNMTVDAIGDQAVVVQFNPWMFSGTEALVSSFFAEIGKQLARKEAKLKDVAGKLAAYGRLLSPLAAVVGAGTAVQGAASILEGLSAAPSVFEQHQELRTLLEGLDKRLVVVVDDVDRLRPNEVLDIVRLVRLVGDSPIPCISLPSTAIVSRSASARAMPRGDVRTSRKSCRSLTTCQLHGNRTSPQCSSPALRRCSTIFLPGRLTSVTGRTSSRLSFVPSSSHRAMSSGCWARFP